MASTTTKEDGTQTRTRWPHRRHAADDETVDLRDDRDARDADGDGVVDERERVDRDRDGVDDRHEGRRRAGFGFMLRIVLATLLLAAVAVVAIVNTTEVELDYVTDTTTVEMWWIIAASAGAGLLAGILLPRPR